MVKLDESGNQKDMGSITWILDTYNAPILSRVILALSVPRDTLHVDEANKKGEKALSNFFDGLFFETLNGPDKIPFLAPIKGIADPVFAKVHSNPGSDAFATDAKPLSVQELQKQLQNS